eukprot:CAMPEP_0196594544 /NCGR_PEP_ID=MMETSP1081-20130531/78647_1 /TAXON_ID=36882 /ORGANISM="Pyramimonas amylifera, Strain CCMP720" /LENGTH=327 /DNA_ID=CAMNT_0041918835 /DNA_START=538 /DNA_END=1521 /DNA_ORIENTATION=+
MTLHVYRPKDEISGAPLRNREEFEKKYGLELWKDNPQRFGWVSKKEPTGRALRELEVVAWLSGRRRDQGAERSALEIIELSPDGRVKVNPLAHWTSNQVWQYIKLHQTPYNPLHDLGYRSVGDTVSTQKTPQGGGERAGRFAGENRTECGMHSQPSTNGPRAESQINTVRHPSATESGNKIVVETAQQWEVNSEKRARLLGILQIKPDWAPERILQELLFKNPGHHLLLEVYAHWCGHCRHFETTFNQAVLQLQSLVHNLTVARLNGAVIKIPPLEKNSTGYAYNSFPSVFLAKANERRSPKRFMEKHSVEKLVQWVQLELSVNEDL